MKERITKIIIILFVIFILYMVFMPYIIIEMWHVQSGGKPFYERAIVNIKDNLDKTINKDKYNKYLNEYIKQQFGDIVSEKFRIVRNDGNKYTIKIDDLMDSEFQIYFNRETKSCSDSFSKNFFIDPKFQHLYSNWVKRQVGIEDENVELYFNRASCGSRNIGDKPYIDFEKITSLENLEEQICENIHNLYIRSNHYEQGVDIKVDNIDEITEVLNYADLIEDKINSRVFIDNNHFMPSENNHLFISFNVQNGENDLDIKYDYDSNTKMYRYHNKDSEWIEYE